MENEEAKKGSEAECIKRNLKKRMDNIEKFQFVLNILNNRYIARGPLNPKPMRKFVFSGVYLSSRFFREAMRQCLEEL